MREARGVIHKGVSSETRAGCRKADLLPTSGASGRLGHGSAGWRVVISSKSNPGADDS